MVEDAGGVEFRVLVPWVRAGGYLLQFAQRKMILNPMMAGGQDGIKLKCLIFDFDGTIVDSGAIFVRCINELSGEYGYEKITPRPEIRGKTVDEFVRRLGISRERFGEWGKEFITRLRSAMRSAVPFAGMKEVLNRLCMHYHTGILTSNSEQVVRGILNRYSLGAVDFIYPEVPILEKDKAIIELLDQQGLKPHDTIYIGDEMGDIEACRKVGLKIISVCWGFNTKASLERENPDYLVDSPENLSKLLLGS